jgi:hypothetical protein
MLVDNFRVRLLRFNVRNWLKEKEIILPVLEQLVFHLPAFQHNLVKSKALLCLPVLLWLPTPSLVGESREIVFLVTSTPPHSSSAPLPLFEPPAEQSALTASDIPL